MLVYERMTHHPITVHPDMPIEAALKLMREEKVRRFPVVDRKMQKLVGMVTEKDLLYASPSPATSLSIHEIHYLLSKVTVVQVMSKTLYTIAEDTPIEEAARIMVDNNVGALPVMRGDTLVGIITETDLFKMFIELFAARQEGVRITLLVPEKKGALHQITQVIQELNGNIVSLGTFRGEDLSNRLIVLKVAGVQQADLVKKLESIGARVVDVRTCSLIERNC
ncbi:MAG: CBS domain-containing protein [Anaerolineae bacterium]|nr:CBS domain-containing protein [Anaerolineae bacterium]